MTRVPCAEGETRCAGATHQICANERFIDNETCGGETVCFASIGCGQCDPALGSACMDNAVVQCLPDGTLGGQFRDCGESGCSQGQCNTDCSVTGVDLIYAIDDEATLYSFDPETLPGNPFVEIGTLECPASDPLPDFNGGADAIPFSMSVDRSGRAWVLYTSGEIFWVSTVDGRCQLSPYQPGSGGFELFGMGFVSNSESSDAESLYISGGDASATTLGDLGIIDPETLSAMRVGALSATTIAPANTPELTGTGAGRLYGYYPGNQSAVIGINKATGAEAEGWELDPSGGDLGGWAFAHWAGEFYIFLTIEQGISVTSSVRRFNPTLGSETVELANTGIRIVGAGVSTCAPTGEP